MKQLILFLILITASLAQTEPNRALFLSDSTGYYYTQDSLVVLLGAKFDKSDTTIYLSKYDATQLYQTLSDTGIYLSKYDASVLYLTGESDPIWVSDSTDYLSKYDATQLYLQNIVEDTSPELGGEFDANGNNIIDLGDVTFKGGANGGTLRTGTTAADKFVLQAYDTGLGSYLTMLELDSGNPALMNLSHVSEIFINSTGAIHTQEAFGSTFLMRSYDVDGGAYRDLLTFTANNNPMLQVYADYLEIEDAIDTSKVMKFDLSGITTGTQRTLTIQDADGTVAYTSDIPTTEAGLESKLTDVTNVYTNNDGALDDDDVTSADVGLASPNLDDTDASIEWEDASDLDLNGDVIDDSHNHIIGNVDNLQTSLDSKLDASQYTTDSTAIDVRFGHIEDDTLSNQNRLTSLEGDTLNYVEWKDTTGIVATQAQVKDSVNYLDSLRVNTDHNPSFVELNGTSQYYSVADNDNLNFGTGDFSISGWFLSPTTPSGNDDEIVSKRVSGVGYRVRLTTLTGRLACSIEDGTTTVTSTADGANLGDNKWHFFVVVFDRDGNMTRYVDGSLYGTADDLSSANLTLSSASNLFIGAYPTPTNYFSGKLSNIKLYNKALTQSEVTDLYNSGHPETYETPYADRGASQSNIVGSPSNNSTFTNGTTTDWTGTGAGVASIDDANNWLQAISTTSSDNSIFLSGVSHIQPNTTIGKRYRISITAKTNSGTANANFRFPFETVEFGGSESVTLALTESLQTFEYERTYKSNENVRIYKTSGATDTLIITNFTVTQIGEVASYSADNILGDTWYDASGNSLNATASGSPAVVKRQTIGAEYGAIDTLKAKEATITGNLTLQGYVLDELQIGSTDNGAYTLQNNGAFYNSGNATVGGKVNVGTFLNLGTPTELTLSSGAVTVTRSYHQLDTEGDVALDTLTSISGGTNGDILILTTTASARDILLQDDNNVFNLSGDFLLDTTAKKIILVYNSGRWEELSRGSN